MTAHFLQLQGAATINTRFFALTQRAVADVTDANAMGAIHGEAGLGKTFAVTYARAESERETCMVEFPGRATMKQVARALLFEITGVRHEGERFRLTDDLIDILGQRERLVIVDEAQRLNHECIEYLRHMHDHPNTTFALLLVGGNGCWRVLSRYPMLQSRIFRRVAFQPLTCDEVTAILPGFHPIYVEADPKAIELVDALYARGNFRSWASFTHTASALCDERGEEALTMEAARYALGLMGANDA